MAKHDFFWAGDEDLPVQPPGRDREQGKGESAHAGRGQFGCRARAVGKARAGKPSTRAGFQKERSATARQGSKATKPLELRSWAAVRSSDAAVN